MSGVAANTAAFHATEKITVMRMSFAKYRSASSMFPAPMHWPMTVMNTGPNAAPASAAKLQMLCATPLAAIW